MKKAVSLLLALLLAFGVFAACAPADDSVASVQSVAMICGIGPTGFAERYSGIVSARGETEVKADENRAIAELAVKEGDFVTAGQVLFTYDMDQAELALEKAQLELEQLKAAIESKEKEIVKLEEQQKKASADNQLNYTLAIQECETAIRESTYNITQKEREITRLENSLTNLDVYSPVDGKIRELNEDGGYDNYGNPKSFMTIMESGTYRVKGYVNENNISSLMEGTPVIVRSRMDDTLTRPGFIAMIDWENPVQSGSNYYYVSSESDTTTSSKYPFYVELEDAEGLLLGQHVFIEPDYGQEEDTGTAIMLPEYYLNDVESGAWVWAQDAGGKLEKRSVTLGAHDEMMSTYEITAGLTAEDYIAFPEEELHAGMNCVTYDESAFNVDGGFDFGEPIPPMGSDVIPGGELPEGEWEASGGEYEEGCPEGYSDEPVYEEFGEDVWNAGEGGEEWSPVEGEEGVDLPEEGAPEEGLSEETAEGSPETDGEGAVG